MKRVGYVILFTTCFFNAAIADDGFTGNLLDQACSSDQDQMKLMCEMWIAGFSSGVFASRGAAELGRSACFPPSFTNHQAQAIIKKYISDNPEKLHEPAEVIAFLALEKVFPCKLPKQ